jgi:hypothetical protein
MKNLFENWKKFINEAVNISYSGVVLYNDPKNNQVEMLKQKALEKIPELKEGYIFKTKAGEELPHHMTINMGPLKMAGYKVGDEIELKVISFGVSKDAVAAEVKPPFPIDTKSRPHITIAIAVGGTPFNSNKIQDWRECEPITIKGVVQEVPQK